MSHDRYFINQTATRILDLNHGLLNSYDGNYDDYLEKKDHPTTASSGVLLEDTSAASEPAAQSSGKLDYKKQKALQAQERKLRNTLKRTEERIEVVEARIADLDEAAMDENIATNAGKLMEIQKEKETLEAELEELMEQWESLSETVEEQS